MEQLQGGLRGTLRSAFAGDPGRVPTLSSLIPLDVLSLVSQIGLCVSRSMWTKAWAQLPARSILRERAAHPKLAGHLAQYRIL